MAKKNELIWLAPEKFNTRRAEISAKKPSKELVIDGSGVAVKDKPQILNSAINSDLDLVLAMRRRALAFDLVGLMSFDVANRYHQALVQRLQEAPPPNNAKVSIAQVLRADRAAFLRLAELLPTLRRSGVGKLPLDEQLPNILLDPSATLQRLEGQPLSKLVTVEVFCGTGRLSASLRSEGFDAFGVDHVVGKTACCSVLQLDLTCADSIAHLWSILKDPAVKFIHFAPPCGTASRARDIQFPGAPPVLRNESHPEGVPDLSEIPALRVQKANMLYKLTLELSSFCLLNGKYFSCENPSRSYLWLLPQWQQFLKRSDVFQTVFHHCEFGGMRRKETLLVHNIPKFRELHRLCSGKHVHLGWGKVGRTWATSAETAYPWGLCKCMASLLKDHFLELGCRQSPKAIDEGAPAIQGARAFTGAQTRKRVPPLLSEFASVHTVTVPSNLAASFLRPGQKLPSPWKPGDDAACSPAIECFPAGAEDFEKNSLLKPPSRKRPFANVLGCPEASLGLNPDDTEVREAMMSGSAERVASLVNKLPKVHRKDLSLLLDLLPSEPLRWEGDAGAKSFQGGSFVHGPMCGVRSTTKQFPETVKAMCSYVKGLFPGLEFGTVGMFRDVSAQPHRDSNNEVSTDNAIAALSDFSDGSVWMEDPAGDVELEIKGRAVRGVCIPVTHEGFRFDGRRLHCTRPWTGRRDVIVAYMPRGPKKLKAEHASFLTSLGFVLDRATSGSQVSPGDVTKAVIGVYRTPSQFVEQAIKVGHPTQLSALMPSEISCAVRRIHKEGEANVAKERTATLRRWVSRAADLEPAERALKADLPQFRKDVLSPKRLALFEELLLEVGHEDVDLVKDIAHGFDLTGKLPRSNVFAKRFRPAEQSESQLRSSAKRLRDGPLATIKASEDPVIDQGVLKATMKELERGFVDGLLSPDQIPEDASLTHRFGVIQGSNEDGPKVRPIDNYLSSQVNAAVTQVEQVSVHTIDVVAGMLACWLNEWFISGRPEHSTPVCKAWDLRTAYKQLPLSDLAYALDSFFVLFNIERGASEIYRQRVLPFGSTASVTSFIRTAYAIWKLGAVGLTLVWSEYFDDYLNLCGKAFARHNDFVISMLFQLLGWEISKDKELSYDALCVVLGVQVNLRDAKLGLAYLENTVKRRTEALCDIERALATGKLEPKESEKLRGRLQFACCQIFGRRPKAALKLLSQHSRQRRWDVSQLTRLALTQLKSFLESSKPRPVRARREDFVHVYVDASFEPNGHCGLGGVVFSSSGEALCWFGQAVAPVHVQKLLKAGDRERETVIFELEALVLSICLEAFRPYVERKGVVIFTDNEGVFGSFVRGHSDNASCAALIDFFACCEESLETICWLDRVPSSSNPADDPSRGVSIRGAPRVDLDLNLLSRALPEVFGSSELERGKEEPERFMHDVSHVLRLDGEPRSNIPVTVFQDAASAETSLAAAFHSRTRRQDQTSPSPMALRLAVRVDPHRLGSGFFAAAFAASSRLSFLTSRRARVLLHSMHFAARFTMTKVLLVAQMAQHEFGDSVDSTAQLRRQGDMRCVPDQAGRDHRATCPALFQLAMTWFVNGGPPEAADVTDLVCLADITKQRFKTHMQRHHGELWRNMQPRVQLLCAEWTGSITIPCMMDTEIQDVFAGCLPALAKISAVNLQDPCRGKRSRQEPEMNKDKQPPKGGKGKGGRRDNDGRGRGHNSWGSWDYNHGWDANGWDANNWGAPHRHPRPNMEQLVEALCRLTLKQEEELQLIRTEKQFLLHLESGTHGLLAPLWQVAQAWKDEATIKKMEAQGWVKVQGEKELHWTFQQWNAESRRLELDATRPPIGHTQMVQIAHDLQQLVMTGKEELIHRFHSTRKLTETVTGDTLPFILSVAMRGTRAQQAHDLLRSLTGSAALRLVGVRIRGERMNLQPLAQHIAKMAAALRR
ncbi:car [Symbiodinium sp. CCMP2592]|nr:car [Symbiodinium sp. CCMP2592]